MVSVRTLCAVLAAVACSTTIAVTQTPPQPSVSQPQAPSAESVKKAEQVLSEARTALGGDKLAAIKTLTASGRTRRIRGNNLQPIDFELLIEQPDKYVRVDEFPAEDTDPTSAGFNGDALIQNPAPSAMPAGRGVPAGAPPGREMPAGRAPAAPPAGAAPPPPGAAMPPGMMPGGGRGPMMDPRRARLNTVKQDYTRLA